MKRQPLIAFSTFFAVANQHLSAQSYTARTVVLLKQVLTALKEEKQLTGGIVEIINELLTILVYRTPLTVSEREAAIFIRTLIQKINRFERILSSREVAKLISIYTVLPKQEDLKELKETSKFTKASGWIPPITSEKSKEIINKIPDSRISPWNTLGIPENISRVNFIGLNKEKSNPWEPSKEKLISLFETLTQG